MAWALSHHSLPGRSHFTAAFLCPLTVSCIPGDREAASFHWSVLETEQECWCSPSGHRPAQARLLDEWGSPGGKG